MNTESWILADPDSFEEDLASEALTIIVDWRDDNKGVLRIQKTGGAVFNRISVSECLVMAQAKRGEMMAAVKAEVRPNDEQAANYVVSNAIGILCPEQLWVLRKSAAGYRPAG